MKLKKLENEELEVIESQLKALYKLYNKHAELISHIVKAIESLEDVKKGKYKTRKEMKI